MDVIGFDHLVLRCADVERSLAFYLGQLGLEPVRVAEWRRGDVLFPSARIDAATTCVTRTATSWSCAATTELAGRPTA